MESRREGDGRQIGRRDLLIGGALGVLGCAAGPPVLAAGSAGAPAPSPQKPRAGHPRLYFTAADLPRLRKLRRRGVHALIWKNLKASADGCLKLTPRQGWIAPVEPDPVYENLYDRFYAIMGDLAVTEHLSFAWALSGEDRYGEAARAWVLASCRAWKREADSPPDGAKAYAVCRLLKGVAVGYDCLHSLWAEGERREIRDTLARIGDLYYDGYFTTPRVAGPEFHTHHAVVEWGSFGVAALALLGEHPPAAEWLAAAVRKFDQHLLPDGLAPDGAQTEGATFWASTMHYRLFFMDPLRRVTGRNLFTPHAGRMRADLALAAVAARKEPGHDEDHETVILEPSYGQLNYYAPALLALARECRRPLLQRLALWDRSLGGLQDTRYVTPGGEVLRFELGGYAYLWYDPDLEPGIEKAPLHYHFPSVEEAYIRESWEPGGIVAGVRRGCPVVHAGGRVVFSEVLPGLGAEELVIREVTDDGKLARIALTGKDGAALTVELHRPGRLVLRRRTGKEWTGWCANGVRREGGGWTWSGEPRAATMTLLAGEVKQWQPDGYRPELAVGFGKLKMRDPLARRYPQAALAAGREGEIVLEIRTGRR